MLLSPASPPSLLRSFGGREASMLLEPPKLLRSVGGLGEKLGEGGARAFAPHLASPPSGGEEHELRKHE